MLGDPLATRPGFNALREEAISEENKITWEVCKTKVQLVSEEASAFSETPDGVQRRPLGRWISSVLVAGRLAVEQYDPTPANMMGPER